MWTTGTVTLRNYIQKKAGLLAEFHHGYGALIVEVDSDGGWYVRQLNADSEGVFYDFDAQVKDGEVTFGHRPEAVVWGDIHVHWLAPKMRELCWGKDGLLDRLDPKVQVMHDVLDFHARKHHDLDDPWLQYAKIPLGKDCVEEECADAGNFLWNASRAWCKTLVVRSNHDDMLVKWLKFADWKADLLNAKFFFRAHLAMLHAIDRGRDFDIIEWALTRGDPSPGVYFLQRDERAIVCPDASGGIELGYHYDVGPNGARGNIKAFAKMGRKSIGGHGHGAGQHEGAMQVGVMGNLDMGYNEGPSNWSHTYALVYPNGKRTLVTIWNGKDRA